MDEAERASQEQADLDLLMLWVEVQELVQRGLLAVDEAGGLTVTAEGNAALDRSRTRLFWPWN